MDYESFRKCIQEELQKLYPTARFILNKVNKNNGMVLDSLVIQENDEHIIPCIYLNQYYNQYQQGGTLSAIVKKISDTYQSAKSGVHLAHDNEVIHSFSDYEKIKDHIIFKVINFNQNQQLLESVPYIKFLDLAVVYMILVQEKSESIGTVLIRTEHMNLWNVIIEELHTMAMKNTPRILPARIQSMESVLRGLVSELDMQDEIEQQDESDLYVMSNTKGIQGAATMLYPEVIANFRNTYCKEVDKIYILPSSIHESILLPCKADYHSDTLQQMVEDINRTQVPEDEVLSDSVYVYSVKDDAIYLADEYVKGESLQ